MNPRILFLLSAIGPLVLGLCTVAIAVNHKAKVLEIKQGQIIKMAYLSARAAELEHYVALAQQAIAPLYKTGRTDEAIKNEAKTILNGLLYGKDGYFFVYDTAGNLLVEPHRPALVGTNRWAHTDMDGKFHIQNFIRIAQAGGGFEDYKTEKPSTKQTSPKRAYVVFLPNWNWVLGTGLYMDDVEGVLEGVGKQVAKNNADMLLWIGGIALFGIAIIIFLGLILNLRERHAAQEAERARFALELHDGVCQELAAIRLNVETGNEMVATLPDTGAAKAVRSKFEKIALDITSLAEQVRGIAHSLYPPSLKDLGLAGALRQLVSVMETSSTNIAFSTHGLTNDLTRPASLALYRVAQVSLVNIINHARAQKASVRLENDDLHTSVIIWDNGIGFDANSLKPASKGMGLRNMKERMEELGGTLEIQSSSEGTTIVATLLKSSPPPTE